MTIRDQILETVNPKHRDAVARALDATGADFEVIAERVRESVRVIRAAMAEVVA